MYVGNVQEKMLLKWEPKVQKWEGVIKILEPKKELWKKRMLDGGLKN